MVLENPAKSVSEVIGPRASSPKRLPRVENAASVRPEPIPTPRSSHANKYQTIV